MSTITLKVNGANHTVDVEPTTPLASAISSSRVVTVHETQTIEANAQASIFIACSPRPRTRELVRTCSSGRRSIACPA